MKYTSLDERRLVDEPMYYKKKITHNLMNKTVKLFVLMPMKNEHCVMCQALTNNRLIDGSHDHDLYRCLTQFLILEYIKCSKGRDSINDAHVKTYIDNKWLRLGPKLMDEFREMGILSLGETIPIRYR